MRFRTHSVTWRLWLMLAWRCTGVYGKQDRRSPRIGMYSTASVARRYQISKHIWHPLVCSTSSVVWSTSCDSLVTENLTRPTIARTPLSSRQYPYLIGPTFQIQRPAVSKMTHPLVHYQRQRNKLSRERNGISSQYQQTTLLLHYHELRRQGHEVDEPINGRAVGKRGTNMFPVLPGFAPQLASSATVDEVRNLVKPLV